MKTRIEYLDDGPTLEVIIHERIDPVKYLPFEKLVAELEYLDIKTIGEFMDNFDAIIRRITNRYPDFFNGADFTLEEIQEFLKYVE